MADSEFACFLNDGSDEVADDNDVAANTNLTNNQLVAVVTNSAAAAVGVSVSGRGTCSSLRGMLSAVQTAARVAGVEATASSVDLASFSQRLAIWDEELTTMWQLVCGGVSKELEDLMLKYARQDFPGFKVTPIKPISARMDALLHVLGGLAHGDHLLDPRTPVRDVVSMLGLDDTCKERERYVILKFAVAEAALGDSPRSGRSMLLLTQAVRTLDRTTAWSASDEALFHASLLQATAMGLYDSFMAQQQNVAIDSQLQPFSMRDQTRAWLRQTLGAARLATRRLLLAEMDDHTRSMISESCAQREQWFKAYEDIRSISAAGRSWCYPWLSPRRNGNDNEQARYWFAAEGDVVMEWIFLLRHDGVERMTTVELLTRALKAWTRSGDDIDGGVETVMVGLNIAHSSAIRTYRDAADAATWPLTHAAAMQPIKHLVIAASDDTRSESEEAPRIVMMRAFCAPETTKRCWTIGDHCRELMATLDDVAVEQCVRHGLLPLLRYAVQHEAQLTEDPADATIDLTLRSHVLEPTGSATWKLMKRALALCASSVQLVQTPSVLQFVLMMMLDNQLPSNEATTFLTALRLTLTTLEDNAIQMVLSSPFIFSYCDKPETHKWTTLDVLWRLSQDSSTLPSSNAITFAPVLVLELIWTALFQLTTHGPVGDVLGSALHQSRLAMLETAIQWRPEALPLVKVFVATLHNVALANDVGGTHALCLTAVPIVYKLVGTPDIPLSREILCHLAHFLARVLHATEQNETLFLQCVLVMERLLQLCESDALLDTQPDDGIKKKPMCMMWQSAAKTLLSALCDLLVQFLTNEAKASAISPDDNNQHLTAVLRVLSLLCKSPIEGTERMCVVANFFLRAARTPCGRFLLLSRFVVTFLDEWSSLAPSSSDADDITRRWQHAIHTVHSALLLCASSNSNVRLLVTGGALRWSVHTTVLSVASGLQSVDAEHVVTTALCDFLTLVGLMTERPVFMARPGNMVRALTEPNISVGALLLAAVWFACRRGQRGDNIKLGWLPLASAVVARCFAVLPMVEISSLLTETPSALARVFGWKLTQQDLTRLLLTVMHETMHESRMKNRTLVKVVHCTLWYASQAGRLNKGIPEYLRDHGMTLIKRGVNDLAEKLSEFQDSADVAESDIVVVLGDIVEKTAQFAHSYLEVVYRKFEKKATDAELLTVMIDAQQAIKMSQGAFYSVKLAKEALIAALSSTGKTSDAEVVESFLLELLCVLEWLVLVVQYGDIDRAFYGHQLQDLQLVLKNLLAIPIDARGGKASSQESSASDRTPRPVSLHVLGLELYSRWVLLGLRPYLVIKAHGKEQFIRFTKALRDTECRLFQTSSDDLQSRHRCQYKGISSEIKTSTTALQHALDVEVRLYLPFWPQDVTLGRVKLSIASSVIDADAYTQKVCPHSQQSNTKALGAILLKASTSASIHSPNTATTPLDRQSLPYSTCGSTVLRSAALKLLHAIARLFGRLTKLLHTNAEKQPLCDQDPPERVWAPKKVLTDSGEVSRDKVQEQIGKLMGLLHSATHHKKMLGSYEDKEPAKLCKPLVDNLERMSDPFLNAVAQAFQAESLKFWEQLGAAMTAVSDCYMPEMENFFFERASETKTTPALASTGSRVVFRELSSQCHFENVVEHGIPGSPPEVLPAHVQDSDQDADWRPLLPLVSVWTLHCHRMPHWDSFERMQAPTSLMHLWLQPIERLQLYAVVLDRLKSGTIAQSNATIAPRAAASLLGPVKPKRDLDKKRRVQPHDGTKDSSIRHSAQTRRFRGWLGCLSSIGKCDWSRRTDQIMRSTAPLVENLTSLEEIRYERLRAFHDRDPLSASRLELLFGDAMAFPSFLYRPGMISTATYWMVWWAIVLTLWRWAAALDAVDEATALFDDAWRVQEAAGREPGAETAGNTGCEKRRIVLKGIAPRQKRSAAIVPAVRVSSCATESITLTVVEVQRIALLVVAKHLVMDLCCVWSAENGNLGLDGFWSSRLFAFVALGFPVLFVAIVVPYAVSHDLAGWLSSLACAYAALWISLALVSILLLTTRLPLFREVRQVTDINLTDSLDCWRNHLVLMNLILEFCQLNTTSLSVWKGMYKPELFVSAVATVDVSNFGVDVTGSVDLFEIRQRVAVAGLVLWWFVLKASNKFRGIPFVNNIVTFVLPNLLSGPLLMSLAKQFYAEMACGESGVPGQYLLRADLRMVCWKREHLYIAFPSLIGMSSFVPIATLAFGSSQVFFPQLNVDLLTAPLINVASQIVKAFMVGALVFFVTHVRLYLGVALFGNLLLFGIVYQLQACCSVWYLRYIKLFVYAASSWSALCALGSTFVPDDVQASVPSCGLHGGWAALLLLFIGVAWRNRPNKAKPVTQKDRQSQTCELKGPPKSIFTTT